MSRSEKKNLYSNITLSDGKKFAKRKVRRWYKDKDFVDGDKAYDKKIYEQWDIVDYKSKGPTYDEFKQQYPEITNEKVLKRKYHSMWLNK